MHKPGTHVEKASAGSTAAGGAATGGTGAAGAAAAYLLITDCRVVALIALGATRGTVTVPATLVFRPLLFWRAQDRAQVSNNFLRKGKKVPCSADSSSGDRTNAPCLGDNPTTPKTG
jgi:hypothetical protein